MILFFERTSEHPPTKISDGSLQGTSMAASNDVFLNSHDLGYTVK